MILPSSCAIALVPLTGQDCQEAQSARAADLRSAALRSVRAVLRARRDRRAGRARPLLLALGQAHLLAQHPADALATLDRIPAEDPDYVQALKVKAKALYLLRRDADAEETLKRAAARAPADAEIPYDLGRIYYQLGRHTEAAAAAAPRDELDAACLQGVGQPRPGDGGAWRCRAGAAALPEGARARPQGSPPLRRRLRQFRRSDDQARRLPARVRSCRRSGAAQSRRGAQFLSRRQGARAARDEPTSACAGSSRRSC